MRCPSSEADSVKTEGFVFRDGVLATAEVAASHVDPQDGTRSTVPADTCLEEQMEQTVGVTAGDLDGRGAFGHVHWSYELRAVG